MDINILRSAVTLISLVVFLGIWAWTYSRRRAHAFEEAAMLPILEDDQLAGLAQTAEKGARS